jgi:hypothetical protein
VLLNHNTFSSYAATWMLLLLLRADERDRLAGAGPQRLGDHALVGGAGGVVLVFLQTKGLLLIAAAAGFTLVAVGGKRACGPPRRWSRLPRPSSPRCCWPGGRRCWCANGSWCR